MYDVGFVFPGEIKKIDNSAQITPDPTALDQKMMDVEAMVFCQLVGLFLDKWMREPRS
jgi:hypothetical protein